MASKRLVRGRGHQVELFSELFKGLEDDPGDGSAAGRAGGGRGYYGSISWAFWGEMEETGEGRGGDGDVERGGRRVKREKSIGL